ncbi:MAG: glycosyltransferase family 2 protein, partial [Acutalibacter sp.]|nr:glycosyltransferase family 2 protein [Acutalibacter sp.]
MRDPFISVIIPVYNAAAYLPACLESILAQDDPALEVVLVDDGSTDASSAICEQYAQEHKDWQVLHTENQGAGPARNTGMALARGEYLMFMDSDDLLAGPGAVGLLAELARREEADVVLGGACRQGPEGGLFGRVAPEAESAGARRQVDFLFRAFFSQAFMVSLHGKLYRREFVERNRLACGSRRLMEDKFFNLCCCACGPVYAFTQETVYLYRDNKSSVTARYTPDMAGAWFGVAEDLKAFLISRELEEEFAALAAFQVFFGLVSFVFHERAFCRQGLGA